ncbi:transglutaminase domain-containing protein [Cohnella zeiphila]|uniref:Transglutaminase n=1 Tax=Cohnella zeiphila TaxID=2761120 RepID=A0A7X0VVJ9_9BACL|nr:transglutaminase domain-containing protein [Cohnella zeiphila]MBB6732051.1 transglutaminase [Cohnella zeiphila]
MGKNRGYRAGMAGVLLSAVLIGSEAAPFPFAASAAAETAAASAGQFSSAIFQKLQQRSESFTLQVPGSASASLKTAEQAFETAMKQDDYVNYAIKSYRYASQSDGKRAKVTIQVTYWENASQYAYVESKTKQIAASIFKTGMNDHQKVKAVHDWVLLHVAYDRTLRKHSAYDALATGQTVCQGYASLTYLLLKKGGVTVRIAEGTVPTGSHAWNLVKLDGKWYHLDTTFDDPVPDVKGRTEYGYYLLTDAQIRADHKWTLTYPAATTSYRTALSGLLKTDPKRKSFYNGLSQTLGYPYLQPENTAKSTSDIASRLKAAVKAGKSALTVRYVNGSSAKVDLQALLDAVSAVTSIRSSAARFPAGGANDVLLTLTFQTD